MLVAGDAYMHQLCCKVIHQCMCEVSDQSVNVYEVIHQCMCEVSDQSVNVRSDPSVHVRSDPSVHVCMK